MDKIVDDWMKKKMDGWMDGWIEKNRLMGGRKDYKYENKIDGWLDGYKNR